MGLAYRLDQRLGNVSFKGPDGKYFRLSRPPNFHCNCSAPQSPCKTGCRPYVSRQAGRVPIKLYLQKRVLGRTCPPSRGSLAPVQASGLCLRLGPRRSTPPREDVRSLPGR